MRMTASHPTDRAVPLIGTMAKHFGHKIPVAQDDAGAVLSFPMGAARLTAGEGALHLTLEADDAEAMESLRDVVERHLLRFAHRDEPAALTWSPAA